MRGTAARLAAFGLALAAVFGLAYAAGAALDPIGVETTETQHGGEHR